MKTLLTLLLTLTLTCSAASAGEVGIEPWLQRPLRPYPDPIGNCRLAGHWELRRVIEWGPWHIEQDGIERRYGRIVVRHVWVVW